MKAEEPELKTGDLVASICSIPAITDLLKRVENGGLLPLEGVHISAQPFFAALLHAAFPNRPVVVITSGVKAQEVFQQDLETWFAYRKSEQTPNMSKKMVGRIILDEPGEEGPENLANPSVQSRPSEDASPYPRLLYFPSWEVLPQDGKMPHADIISERLETLITLSEFSEKQSGNSGSESPSPRGRGIKGEGETTSIGTNKSNATAPIITTSVAALMQKTFPPDYLSERIRHLKRGETIDPLDLIQWLEDQGYEPEAQVTSKGEIALRGGIVDIFPPPSPWPVRLEFFGDELESLRYFDPVTQVSREEIESIAISPAGELGLLRQMDSRKQSDSPALATLLDYLLKSGLVLFCSPDELDEHAKDYSSQLPVDDPLFTSWENLRTAIQEQSLTEIELRDEVIEEKDDLGFRSLDAYRPITEKAPDIQIQEAQRREFFNQLHRWQRQGYSVNVFCNNTGEKQRFEEITKDYGLEWDSKIQTRSKSKSRSKEHEMSDTASLSWGRGIEGEGEENKQESTLPDSGTGSVRASRAVFRALAENPDASEDTDPLAPKDALPRTGEGAGSNTRGRVCSPDETESLAIHIGALSRGFIYEPGKLVIVTDAEIFGRYKVQCPRRLKSPHAQATRSALDIDFSDLEEGDYVVHLQHGIGRYLGLTVIETPRRKSDDEDGTKGQECLAIEYAPSQPDQPPAKLYVPVSEAHLVSKYAGAAKVRPQLHRLGGARWNKAKQDAEKAVEDLAAQFLSIQAKREALSGHAFETDTTWQREFEDSFLYEETPHQQKAIEETKTDMESTRPMDRLICGDVGYGKTEVAIRAAFKAVMNGKQVALLVPTTVLAQQHFVTFTERMADYPVRIDLLSRFRSRKELSQTIADLAAGSVDIVIGTHRLIQKDVLFKDLGLVIIDEEQRFGVLHKEKFKQLRELVDVLTLSATPIPRTLYLALTGARDMSTIETPPQDRLPVETYVIPYDVNAIRNAIQREINRGGQVFFLHNRVSTIETMAQKIRELVPHARLLVGHGQMNADDLEDIMTQFVNGEADVLLSTTIIESGIDIPNANTIIIDRADRFGLSQLYQLRGRVGRYRHQAYAYLLLPRHARLLTDVRKRMNAIKQYSSLGSGFKIAMRDLEIRGAGNLLGPQQSGHITAIGFDLYCQLLKQSVGKLKGEKPPKRVEVQVQLDFLDANPGDEEVSAASTSLSWGRGTEGEGETTSKETTRISQPSHKSNSALGTHNSALACLPYSYIKESRHRIEIYRRFAQLTEKSELEQLEAELKDRFGKLPPAAELLILIADARLIASERSVTSIEVRDNKLMLTRGNDLLTIGGKFPRLSKKQPQAKLKEILRFLRSL